MDQKPLSNMIKDTLQCLANLKPSAHCVFEIIFFEMTIMMYNDHRVKIPRSWRDCVLSIPSIRFNPARHFKLKHIPDMNNWITYYQASGAA